jgi:hypothetical protein
MANASNYLKAQIADHIARTSSFTKPSALYLALCTDTVTAADTGSTITEPSGGGYARISIGAPSDSVFDYASGVLTNADILEATATGDWGTITDVAICDASTNGNMLIFMELDASKAINSDVFQIPVADLEIEIS